MTLMDIINMHKQCLKFSYDSMYPIRPDMYEIEEYRREHRWSRVFESDVNVVSVISHIPVISRNPYYLKGEFDAFYWMLNLNDRYFSKVMSQSIIMIGGMTDYRLGFNNEVCNYRDRIGFDIEVWNRQMNYQKTVQRYDMSSPKI